MTGMTPSRGDATVFGRCLTARAAAATRWSLLHVSSKASIAIAAFAAIYFGLQLLRGVL